jgi:hypothetical protein
MLICTPQDDFLATPLVHSSNTSWHSREEGALQLVTKTFCSFWNTVFNAFGTKEFCLTARVGFKRSLIIRKWKMSHGRGLGRVEEVLKKCHIWFNGPLNFAQQVDGDFGIAPPIDILDRIKGYEMVSFDTTRWFENFIIYLQNRSSINNVTVMWGEGLEGFVTVVLRGRGKAVQKILVELTTSVE